MKEIEIKAFLTRDSGPPLLITTKVKGRIKKGLAVHKTLGEARGCYSIQHVHTGLTLATKYINEKQAIKWLDFCADLTNWSNPNISTSFDLLKPEYIDHQFAVINYDPKEGN